MPLIPRVPAVVKQCERRSHAFPNEMNAVVHWLFIGLLWILRNTRNATHTILLEEDNKNIGKGKAFFSKIIYLHCSEI